MNIKKLLILVILITVLSQLNLFSLITSRVEGTVEDEETGEPIEGAKVYLAKASPYNDGLSYEIIKMVNTVDKKGFFRFDHLEEEGMYIIAVFKEGYGSFGPFIFWGECERYNESGVRGGYLDNFLDKAIKYGWIAESEVKIDTFVLKQGQVKHFKIRLEKEAVLEMTFYRKISNGKELLKDFGEIEIFHNKYYAPLEVHNNPFRTHHLREGIVGIICCCPGYVYKDYKNMKIEKGKVTTIEHVLDFTKGQVLHGFAKKKGTGEPLINLGVYLSSVDINKKGYPIGEVETDYNGEFWFGGFESGKYILETGILTDDNGPHETNYKKTLDFSSGERKEIVIDIELW